MEIILTKDIEKLGAKDEVVKVRDGYARNYLLPNGLAIIATEPAKKVLAENLKQRAHKEARLKEEALKTAEKIKNFTFKIGAKAGDSGKIFGSVNTVQLADAIRKAGFEVERKNVVIKAANTIKTLGTYEATVKLYKDVIETIKFDVVEE